MKQYMASSSNRIDGFDLARALAVVGMVVVNFSTIMGIGVYPSIWMGAVVDFIYGRAATIFVILAGVSLSLMAAKQAPQDGKPGQQTYLMKRCALLLVAGTLQSFWWTADILHVYALFIALGAWMMRFSTRALVRWTLASVLISLPVSAALTVSYDLADGIAFVDHQHWAVRLLLDYATSRYYPLFPWISFLLVGMLLGRMERSGRFNGRLWAPVGALVCVAIEVLSASMMAWVEQHDWDIEGNGWIVFLRSESFPVTPLFIFSSGAGALAVIGLCKEALRHRFAARCMRSVIAFGRLSLTVYVTHLLLAIGLTRWITAHGGVPDAAYMFNAVGLYCCAGIPAATMWLRCFKRGPLETLFHRLAGSRWSIKMRQRACPAAKT
jgi:uncharacterized protein